MSKRPRGSDSIDSGPVSMRAPLPCDQAPLSVTDEAHAILANCRASQWSLPAGALAAPATDLESVVPPHDTTAPQANRPRAMVAPHTTKSITVGFTGARDGMTPPQAASMERWLAHLEATSCGVPSHALPGLSQTAQEQQESDRPDNTGHTVAATDTLPPPGTAAAPATPDTKPQTATAPTSTMNVPCSGNDETATTGPRHLRSSSPRKPASLLLLHGQCIGADAEVHALAAARSERWRIGLLPSNLAASTATHCAASPTAVAMAAPAAPLKRNKAIVDRSCVVLAAPPTEFEVLRSGSWSTIRYTAKARRPLVLVLPSGAVKVMARGWCPELMADA